MRKHCRFFTSAAAAQQAGFRACLRCRPEIAPQSPAWRGTASTVSRAMARIAEGALDGPRASVERLADSLGVGERQLRRLFDQHIGASPLAVAQTRRVLFAKQLLHETRLPMASVAMAAGFGSIRRFNDTFLALYKRPPSQLRRRSVTASSAAPLVLRLAYRPPFDWNALLAFFTPRAIPGVEEVRDGIYRRVVRVDDHVALIAVSHLPARNALQVEIACDHVPALPVIASRLRRVFDLDADTEAIAAAPLARPRSRPHGAPPARPAHARRMGCLRDRRPRHPRPADQRRRRARSRGKAGRALRPAPRPRRRRPHPRLSHRAAARRSRPQRNRHARRPPRRAHSLAHAAVAHPEIFEAAEHARGEHRPPALHPRHRRVDRAVHRAPRPASSRRLPRIRHRHPAQRGADLRHAALARAVARAQRSSGVPGAATQRSISGPQATLGLAPRTQAAPRARRQPAIAQARPLATTSTIAATGGTL